MFVAIGWDTNGWASAQPWVSAKQGLPDRSAEVHLTAEEGEGPYSHARWVELVLPAPSEPDPQAWFYSVDLTVEEV